MSLRPASDSLSRTRVPRRHTDRERPIGHETLAAVRDGGTFVAVTGPDTPEIERGIEAKAQYVHHDEAAEPHRRLAGGGLPGRLVLVP